MDTENYIRIFTLKGKEEIEKLELEHQAEPHLRKLQKIVAENITIRVHGQQALDAVLNVTEIFMSKDAVDRITVLDTQQFLGMLIDSGTASIAITKSEMDAGVGVVELLTSHTKMFDSNGDAMKMIKGNGVSLNKQKVTDPKMIVNVSNLINGKYILLQKGKNDFCVGRVV